MKRLFLTVALFFITSSAQAQIYPGNSPMDYEQQFLQQQQQQDAYRLQMMQAGQENMYRQQQMQLQQQRMQQPVQINGDQISPCNINAMMNGGC